MKYLVDNMLNGLAKELPKVDIDCETVIHAVWNDDDSAQPGRWDAQIFRFLLEKKFTLNKRSDIAEDYVIITADKDLERYCREFGIECRLISLPATNSEYRALVAELVSKLKKKNA
jgi:predicted nuclease of predicted toxin-antitoxin system